MAAYDLPVQRPGMLQVPDTVNQGSRNLMQFMRFQQQRKNEEERLELERENAQNLADFRAGQLDLDKQRTDNQRQNLIDTLQLNRDKFKWDQGAQGRQEEAAKRLNQALGTARENARGSLVDGFQVSEGNMAAFNQFADENNIAVEDRAEVLRNYISGVQNDIGLHSGKRKYEEALRRQYANTSASPEQIDARVQAELNSVFPEQNNKLSEIMARNSGSTRKPPSFDDAGNLIDNDKYVRDWMGRADVEEGKRSWFRNATDFGETDLTEQNVGSYISEMSRRGFNPVEALSALEVARDGDTAGADFDNILSGNVGDSNAVIDAATRARNLKYANQGGQNGNGLGGFLSQMMNQNAPTTELQRREILLGMLGQKMQQAQAGGPGAEQAGADAQDIAQTLQGNTQTDPNAQQQLPSQVNGENLSKISGLAQLLGGSDNKQNAQNVIDSIGYGFDTVGNAVGSAVYDGVDALNKYIDKRGAGGIIYDGWSNSAPGLMISMLSNIGTESTPQETIADLESELRWIQPDSGRAKVIRQQIEAIKASLVNR